MADYTQEFEETVPSASLSYRFWATNFRPAIFYTDAGNGEPVIFYDEPGDKPAIFYDRGNWWAPEIAIPNGGGRLAHHAVIFNDTVFWETIPDAVLGYSTEVA